MMSQRLVRTANFRCFGHVRTQMAAVEERDAQSGGHRGNDACSARAFEDGFEVLSPFLPDVERPASVEAVVVEGEGRDRAKSVTAISPR